MSLKQKSDTLEWAVAELHEHCADVNARRVVESLTAGLTQLRNLFIVRTQDDVSKKYGTDSMIGTSLAGLQKKARAAKVEIEAYACIVADDEATLQGYVDDGDKWFLDWIFRLRLGDGYKSVLDKRVDYYRSRTVEDRRLKFVSVLQRVIPESAKAPLVLFRLFPRSVRILAALAFDDALRARQVRAEQIGFLPAIGDCHECHGGVLDNEDNCRCCGNPVWNYAFLLSD